MFFMQVLNNLLILLYDSNSYQERKALVTSSVEGTGFKTVGACALYGIRIGPHIQKA